ncbi:MAG: hypothetical protein OXH45_03240 [Gammaproteobacteria bacterium]|nr:hypothetical protein [Gammaproteobacteria bacterium]
MAHSNPLIAFLRHYGPIPASDNMYDELIQTEIQRHKINPVIEIEPICLQDVVENFKSDRPRNVILTGTAGDGKTYLCRRAWALLGGEPKTWEAGEKIVSLTLPNSGKSLTVVKDLSELTQYEKDLLLAEAARAVTQRDEPCVYLIAANDGQLLASWRDWSEAQDEDARRVFRLVEALIVSGRTSGDALNLNVFNLSRLQDASQRFQELADQVLEHPQWQQCNGCDLLEEDGTTACPIRINRERLRGSEQHSTFRTRLGELLKLARANGMHMPIRDLLLLLVNVLLGDRKANQVLLKCRTARNRARAAEYSLTNPYANVFGMNLSSERHRQQYQIFSVLKEFGIGRETDNKFDNLIIYDAYAGTNQYESLVSDDPHYGATAYIGLLRDYLEGERENIDEFMLALSRQRQRLFFSLPTNDDLNPWRLTVFQASGRFLYFLEQLKRNKDVSETLVLLVQGLNRTFCGMMMEDRATLYLASSGGDGRGRIAFLLENKLAIKKERRNPYVRCRLSDDKSAPSLQIVDPAKPEADDVVDSIDLQLTHFEYLVRVAKGSLPTSFSRQCYEDFLDFKLRLISKLAEAPDDMASSHEVDLQVLTVDDQGRAFPDDISIRLAS